MLFLNYQLWYWEVCKMVKFYYNMVILDRIAIDKVPSQYREQVKALLEKEQQI